MTTDWYAPTRLLIVALLVIAAIAIPGVAAARPPITASGAKRTLRALGYRQVHVSCFRKSRCRWHGVRAGQNCKGAIAARNRGRARLVVSHVRCRRPADAGRPPLLFGFNAYTTQTTLAKQLAVGATVTRLFVNWWQVEPVNGSWNWTNTDRSYRQIIAAGLRPLVVVNGAPCWAESSCNLVFAAPPSQGHDSDWSAYVRAVTMRYPKAIAIEVWNEPNLAQAFYPQANPARYTALLHEAYTAVKSVDHAMPVISGGLAMNDGTGFAGPGYTSRTFLADMYADGAAQWMNGVAIHVYPTDIESNGQKVWDPAAMSRWLQQVKGIGTAAGVPDMPIWVTEMGVSTTTEHGFPPAATPAQQASDLLAMVQAARADPDVRAAMIDTLQDAAPNPIEDIVGELSGALTNYDVFYNKLVEGLGIFESNWTPKPAACAISRNWGGSLTC